MVTATPPPSSAAQSPPFPDDSRPEESDSEPEPKALQHSAAETMPHPPQQEVSEPEPPHPVMSEIEPPQQVKSETEPAKLTILEPEPPQQAVASEPEPRKQVTSETEPPQQVKSETEPPQNAASEVEPPEQAILETALPQHVVSEPETQEQVTSETEPPQQGMPEPGPPQKVTPEPERHRHVDVSDWTEPEPPEAAVLKSAAAEPEQELPKPSTIEAEHILGESQMEPETHKQNSAEPEPAEPAKPAELAAVASRSLAEMMDREEAEEEPPGKSSAAILASSGEEGEPTIQIPRSLGSFKEESNRISDLSESELSSLHELRQIVQQATTAGEEFGGISIWGIPLLKDDRSDVVLLKFLRARDFKAQEAHTMLRETLQWRKEFNIEELIDENLGDDLDKVVFMQGHDREGHAVCYNVYGEFQNKDLYQKTFSDEEKRNKFLRWRIQFLEKSIRQLDFGSGGVSTICQVNDLKNSPGPGKKELRLATKQAVQLLQDNYPEFVSKQIFINVPWWYLAFYKMISPFMTQRSKSKLVFAGPSRSAETLFKYISPEQVPIQYGGLSVDNCDCDSEFSGNDTATEITVKPTTKQIVEIIIYEKCTIVWELRVVGWDVTYGAEFLPENKEAYTVVIQKPRKMSPTDEPVVSQSFKVGELGKILLTIDNPTTKKKKLVYRFKVKPLCE